MVRPFKGLEDLFNLLVVNENLQNTKKERIKETKKS